MSDHFETGNFEDQVRSALRSGVTDELSVVGLAEGARSKLRRRRRTGGSILVAAALVAAVPVGLTALNSGGSGNGPTTTLGVESAEVVGLPAGWHWESWANIEFGVPNSWVHGGSNQWCVGGGGLDVGYVSRPNEMQTLVFCGPPTNGYGATIQDASSLGTPKAGFQYPAGGGVYPDGAWITTLISREWAVVVAAPDEATAQQIADSFRTFAEADANGCAPQAKIPRIGTAASMTAPTSGPIVLCHYSGTGSGDNLTGSDGLSADRAQALLDAMAKAKTDPPIAQLDCAAVDPDATLILRDGQPLGWAFTTGCSDSGIDLGGDVLPMTPALISVLNDTPIEPGVDPGNDPAGSGNTGGPDTSVSNGTVSPDDPAVPPDSPAVPPDAGGGTSGSTGSGSVPGTAPAPEVAPTK